MSKNTPSTPGLVQGLREHELAELQATMPARDRDVSHSASCVSLHHDTTNLSSGDATLTSLDFNPGPGEFDCTDSSDSRPAEPTIPTDSETEPEGAGTPRTEPTP